MKICPIRGGECILHECAWGVYDGVSTFECAVISLVNALESIDRGKVRRPK